jgi:GNAT superfamily N-acetyltransferase
VRIRSLEPTDRGWLEAFIREQWGSDVQAYRGALVRPADHPGFVAEEDGSPVGVAMVRFDGDECEIVTLNAVPRGRGVGTALVDAVAGYARDKGFRRLRVTTTNANLDALRFYQRGGFHLAELRVGAVDRARAELKPEIPETGEYGIPLRDEVELEMRL